MPRSPKRASLVDDADHELDDIEIVSAIWKTLISLTQTFTDPDVLDPLCRCSRRSLNWRRGAFHGRGDDLLSPSRGAWSELRRSCRRGESRGARARSRVTTSRKCTIAQVFSGASVIFRRFPGMEISIAVSSPPSPSASPETTPHNLYSHLLRRTIPCCYAHSPSRRPPRPRPQGPPLLSPFGGYA